MLPAQVEEELARAVEEAAGVLAPVALGEECVRAGSTGDDLAEGGGDDLPTGELIPSLAAEHQPRDKQTCQRERRWA